MVEILIETNAPQLRRRLREFEARQIPFATAKALTKTAFDARAAEVVDMPKRLKIRNRALPRVSLMVEKARKSDTPSPTASVGIKSDFRFLADHETGNVRRSIKGGRLAIPTKVIRRTARGKIPKSQTPRRVAQRKNVREVDELLVRKSSKRRRDRRDVLYLLRRRVRIRKRLGMLDTVGRSVGSGYQANFESAFRVAIQTAKRR